MFIVISPSKWSEESWGEVRRRELKRVETKRGEVTSWKIFFWSPCGGVCGHQVLLYGDGADVRSYCRVRRWFGWRPNCCVSSVSPYLRSLQSAIPRNCVLLTYHSIQWWTGRRLWYNRFVLCELEFVRVQIVHYVSYVGHNFEFRVSSPAKLYIIRLYIYICCF